MTTSSKINNPSHFLPNQLGVIADMIPAEVKLLDVGCSQGHLLKWLSEHKQIRGRGIDICNDKVQGAIADGLSVVQGDVEEDLPHYQDNAYDYIILNQILQQMNDPVAVLSHAARVARYIIVSVPNFGHWRNRWYLATHGKMPVTSQLDYEWYETPNIHFCTLRDFTAFVEMLGLHIERQIILTDTGRPHPLGRLPALANLFGSRGVFLLSSPS